MELTQITETLYALHVPIDAKNFKKERHLLETGRPYCELLYNYDHTNIYHNKSVRAITFEFEIIGTVTQENIDFDCRKLFNTKMGYLESKLYLLLLIDSKGINPTPETKLLIIEKV